MEKEKNDLISMKLLKESLENSPFGRQKFEKKSLLIY